MVDSEPISVGDYTHREPSEPYVDAYTQFIKDSQVEPLTPAEELQLIAETQTGLETRVNLIAELGINAVTSFFGHKTEAITNIDEKIKFINAGKAAKEHLILSSIPLVMKEVRKNVDRGLPKIDVIQNGVIGLIIAINKFDQSQGYRLSTYAVPWIKQQIQRGFHKQAEFLHISATDYIVARRVQAVKARLYGEYEREPTISELAKEAYVTEDEARLFMGDRIPGSLDDPININGNKTKHDTLYDKSSDSVESVAIRNADQLLKLNSAIKQEFYLLAGLTPTQIEIVELRINPIEPTPYKEIGKKLGFSHQYASKQYSEALVKLRQACLYRTDVLEKLSLLA